MAKKEKKNSFKGKTNRNAAKQKAEKTGYGHLLLPKGMEMFTAIPKKSQLFDIIPYRVEQNNHPDMDKEYGIAVKGELWYKLPYKLHRQIGADNESVACLTSFGESCPICDYKKKRVKEGADKDELQAYKASVRNLYAVIPKDKDASQEIHIFDFSQFNFQDLLNDEIDENEDNEDFPDLEDGKTLKVRWSEKTMGTNKFAEANRIDFLKRKKGYKESILDDVPCLDNLLKRYTYEDLEAKFLEIDPNDEGDEDDMPSKKDKKKKKKSKDKGNEIDEAMSKEKSKRDKKKKKSKDNNEPPLTWDDVKDMNEMELSEVIDNKDLDIDTDDYEDDLKTLRKVIADELDIEIPKKKKKEAKDEDEDEDEKPVQKGAGKTTSKTGKNKCPHGYSYGKDTDDHEECEECELWEKCIDIKEK